jgi:hypothetical protein
MDSTILSDDTSLGYDETLNKVRDATLWQKRIVSTIESCHDESAAMHHLRLIDNVLIQFDEGRMLLHMAAVK